jgi:hypothetical protein
MLKSVEGIYDRGEIKLQEKPDDIPQKTKVIVTFLTPDHSDSDLATEGVLSNEEIERTLQMYRQANKSRPLGLCKGEFLIPDDFNEPLPDEILALFEG